MASSTHKHQPLPTLHGVTAAPPPTPSTQPNRLSSSDAADALSRLLHRLPPTLSLPCRLSPPTISPPVISISEQNLNLREDLLSSSSELGFFQLTNHSIPSQLAQSAELESLSLFDLPHDKKQQAFSKNWPAGFDDEEEDGDRSGGESFCFDVHSCNESTECPLSSLMEFARALEKVGFEIVEGLSRAMGFENPLGNDGTRSCSLMWVAEGVAGKKPVFSGRFYPYVIALQYQIRCRKYSMLADSGWVTVSPLVDSVLVTIGDIAQVWSNGKLKKVRGRAAANSGNGDKSGCVTMSLLVTQPMDSTVFPLLPSVVAREEAGGDGEDDDNDNSSSKGECENKEKEDGGDGKANGEEDKDEKRVFCSFRFEDYAWRVYHERLLFKDPLDRYRI